MFSLFRSAPPIPPIGVYIHVPFCVHKCFYCDFYSIADREDLVEEYVDAVITEIASRSVEVAKQTVTSIFFGGGTPSLLTVEQVGSIIDAVKSSGATILPDVEITLEMNPESVTSEKVTGYLEAGVNRASLGVQSFDEGQLQFLQRAHTGSGAENAFITLRAAGYQNISVDLMFGLPGQSMDQWVAQLHKVALWNPEHLSCYEITPERGTPLFNSVETGGVVLADSDFAADLYDATVETLAAHHYHRYEVSNYSRPGLECRHNLGYWHRRDYLGIGAAAHGLLNGVRYKNVPSIERYIAAVSGRGSAVTETERMTPAMVITERLLMGLRLTDGIAWGEKDISEKIARQIDAKLLTYSDGKLRATPQGFALLDTLLATL